MAARRLFGLIGTPVQRSASPGIYRAWFQKYSVEADYTAFDVPSMRGSLVLRSLQTLSVAGANVTTPLKAVMARAVDRCVGDACSIGAVNVVVAKNGCWEGHNTDSEGFVRALEDQFGNVLPGRSVVVLGAGGAAAAVVAGVARRGVRSVRVLNRTPRRGQVLCRRMSDLFPQARFTSMILSAPVFEAVGSSCDLVINCTAAGASGEIATFNMDQLPTSAIWSDLNYWLSERPWLDRCRARGLSVDDGYGMLLHQAALSFKLFTGITVQRDDLAPNVR